MKIYIYLLFCCFSILLYLFSPVEYSYYYCLLIHNIFLIHSIYFLLNNKKDGIVSFNFFFTISFYLANFVYPIFYFPVNSDISLFSLHFNSSVITKATSLSYIAFSMYTTGYKYYSRIRKQEKCNKPVLFLTIRSIKTLFVINVIIFIIYILLGGLKYFADRYQEGVMSINIVVQQIYVLFYSTIIIFALSIFNLNNRFWFRISIIFLAIVCFVLLSVGTRTLPLAIALIFIVAYNDKVKKIRLSIFTILLFVGITLLSILGEVRSGSSNGLSPFFSSNQINEKNIFFDFGLDLIICNRNLYTLFDYVDNNGITYGISILSTVLSPIPLLQGFISNAFNLSPALMNSASFSTFIEFGSNPPLGLGSNIVADVYLAFGMIGVVVLFFFLGYLIAKSKHLSIIGNPYASICYYVLVSGSVFMSRGAFLGDIRVILWGVTLMYLYRKLNLK